MIYLIQNQKELVQVYRNNYYTWYYIWVNLCFIDSHCENTSLSSCLGSLSALSSWTTPYLRSGSNSRSYNGLTKTLNRCSMLTRLFYQTRATEQWTEPLDMTSLSIMKTHMWCTISTCVELSIIRAPLCHCPTFKSRTRWWCTKLGRLWRSNGLEELADLDPKLEELPNDLELLLFLDDWLDIKLNPFLFWKLLRDILLPMSFPSLSTNYTSFL